jgi:hypothetical protein
MEKPLGKFLRGRLTCKQNVTLRSWELGGARPGSCPVRFNGAEPLGSVEGKWQKLRSTSLRDRHKEKVKDDIKGEGTPRKLACYMLHMLLNGAAQIEETVLPFPQFALLHSVTCVQLRLITILENCGCVAVASFLGVRPA